jgi:predicted hydrocarbon binding protein
MASRNKDVVVYRYDPKKKYYLVSLHLENKPGALGNLANLLGIRGINILEGFFGGMFYGPKATVSFFLESTNQQMDEGWLKDFLASSVYVSDVEVKTGVDGFLCDSLNFPITWNSGDRAVLMRVEGLRAMLDAVRSNDPWAGEAATYTQGFTYGKKAWENLFGIHRPKTRESLADMLNIYVATGWGKIELSDVNPAHRTAKVKLSEGFECMGLSTGKPESHFVRGHLAGAFSAYFGSDVKAVETKCTAKGDSLCEFEISP